VLRSVRRTDSNWRNLLFSVRQNESVTLTRWHHNR